MQRTPARRRRARWAALSVLFLVALLGIDAAAQRAKRKRPAPAESASAALSAAPPASAESASPEPAPEPAPPPPVPTPATPPTVVAAPPPAPSVAAPPAAPSTAPAPAPSAAIPPGVSVKLHDTVVFQIRVAHGDKSATERAHAASQALETAADGATPETVRVEHGAGVAIVYAGPTPVVQLYPEDAQAAGDASLDVHAAAVSTSLREAIRSEQKRSAIARRVFFISLVIFFGLVALYVIRKIGDIAERLQRWLADNPERVQAFRLKSLEVVRPATLHSALLLSISVGKWIAQFGIAYVWLVFALSLFASTREYTERLTGFVFAPISSLMGRIATSLPMLLVAGIAALAVGVLVRFVSLFFASVERGETTLTWLPVDLAHPTSLLLRIGIVLAALVFAAPVVTGDPEGALARTGAVTLIALGLAGTPLLASAVVGISVLYMRRLRTGDFVEFGDRFGRVIDVGLLDVRLEGQDGSELRIPHLLALVRPTRVFGQGLRVTVTVTVAGSVDQRRATELLLHAAAAIGAVPRVELTALDADGAHYRVSVSSGQPDAPTELYLAVADALRRASMALGRARPTEP